MMKYLVDAFGSRTSECILINTVIPEYERENLEKIQDFFTSLEWLPRDVVFTASYVDKGKFETKYEGIDSEMEEKIRRKSKESKDSFNPLGSWGSEKFVTSGGSQEAIERIAHDGVLKDLNLIHNRLLVDEPMDFYFMNGCCIPGARRIYVTVEGDYLVCEKMGPSPKIGDVYSGINVEAIRERFVEDFRDEALKYCKNCWAIHLCSLCYTECFDVDSINFNYRHRRCEVHRISTERTLCMYHEILEHDPASLAFLNDYEFV